MQRPQCLLLNTSFNLSPPKTFQKTDEDHNYGFNGKEENYEPWKMTQIKRAIKENNYAPIT